MASPSVWNALPDSLRDPELTYRHFQASIEDLLLQVILDVSHVQRIRNFLVMRYINVRFTYLLTYLLLGPIISKMVEDDSVPVGHQ